MAHILITGSTDGLGRAAAAELLDRGHHVVVHARDRERLTAVHDLLDRGADAVVGDLADLDETDDLARQVHRLGHVDAVIHNAGVKHGRQILPVNVVAPYLLTALLDRSGGPERLVYLSSNMHHGGRPDLDAIEWSGARPTRSYADSKLFVTALAAAVARRWPHRCSNAVDPGWVPTKMGGPSAPDDLVLGHRTQTWLATGDDPAALTTGGYWHHRHRTEPHPAVHDESFQDALLDALADHTGVRIA